MIGAQVVKANDAEVLRTEWRRMDGNGYKDAAADPFEALRMRGVSYGHAANPGLDGYVYRAWVRPSGSTRLMQASGSSLLVCVLTLLLRVLNAEKAN